MKQYIGSKIAQAEPMNRADFTVKYRRQTVVTPDMVCDEGYLVVYEDNYTSWSPKEVFEAAYRRTDGMNFGLALEAAKMGKRIARAGWNGKGMYVFLIDVADLHTNADLSGLEGKDVTVRDCFAMKCADDSICPGWLASQTDMLADDWCVLEDAETMSWGDALKEVEAGAAVRRVDWGDASWVAILEEPAELKGKLCKVCPDTGDVTPDWKPEGEDLEAKDWAKLWGV